MAPDSVTVSDPFALDSRMTLRATGDWCYTGSAGPPLCETVPWLDWGEPETAAEDIGRSWLLPGLWLPPDDPAIARADSAGITVLMVDSGGPGPFPVVSAESP